MVIDFSFGDFRMGSISEGWEIKWFFDLCDLKFGIDGGGVCELGWWINS